MIFSERKKEILRVIVEQHVETAEPVGSKAVAAQLGSSVSSATVRNEMAELELMGLLDKPHTSAGRIPSAQGYRIFVNDLMSRHRLSTIDAITVNNALKHKIKEQSQLVDEAGNLASRLTDYPAYAMASVTGVVCVSRFDFIYIDPNTFIIVILLNNNTVKNKLINMTAHVDSMTLTKLGAVFNAGFTGIAEEKITPALIVSAERAVGDTVGIVAIISAFTIEQLFEARAGQLKVAGTMNLLNHPEYRDIDKAQRIIRYMLDDKELVRLPSPSASGEIKITIGPENLAEELQNSSVMAIRYDVGGDMQGLIGVIGPTRMEYSKVAAQLSYIARSLSSLSSGGINETMGINNSDLGDDDLGGNK